MGRLDSVGFLLKKKVKKRPSKGTSFWGESGEGLNPSDLFLSLRSRSNGQIQRPHTKMKKKKRLSHENLMAQRFRSDLWEFVHLNPECHHLHVQKHHKPTCLFTSHHHHTLHSFFLTNISFQPFPWYHTIPPSLGPPSFTSLDLGVISFRKALPI